MTIDRAYFVQLGGRDFVLFAGLLDAATRAGLRSIITSPVQIASPENGRLAVMKARVEFEDGRVFEAIGDAGPESVGRMIQPHVQRMAETRAIGRALRWALNVAATMKEELGDDAADSANGHGQPQAAVRDRVAAPVRDNAGAGVPAGRPARAAGSAAEPAPLEDAVCEWPACGKHLTQNNRLISQKNASRDLCPEHLTEFRRAKEQAATS